MDTESRWRPDNGCRPRIPRSKALALGGLLVVVASLAAACGGSSSTASEDTTGTSGGNGLVTNPSQWLTVDAGSKSARLVLDAGYGDVNGGFNFDGYANGDLVVTIPVGWKVTVECRVERSAVSHSCAIVRDEGDTTPAFPGAATPDPQTGLAPGQSATFEFVPTTSGEYRIDCLVPGHDPGGMWDTLKVVDSGSPSIAATGPRGSGTGAQNA